MAANRIRMAAYQNNPRIAHKIIIYVDEEEEDLKLKLIQDMIDDDMYIFYIHCSHFCSWLEDLMESWMNTPGETDRIWRFVIFSEMTYHVLRGMLSRSLGARMEDEPEDDDEARERHHEHDPSQIGYCNCGIHYTGIPGVEYEGAGGGLLD